MHILWDLFHTEMLSAIDKFIPHCLHKKSTSLPWLNKRLRSLLKCKARLHKKAKTSNNWDQYHQFQRQCKKEMRQAEWDYINNIILEGLASNNTKPFWRYVKAKRQDNIGVAPLKEGGVLYNDSKGKARILASS